MVDTRSLKAVVRELRSPDDPLRLLVEQMDDEVSRPEFAAVSPLIIRLARAKAAPSAVGFLPPGGPRRTGEATAEGAGDRLD